jgi:hypothetical protein
LIKTGKFNLELQRSTSLAARQRHQQTGGELIALGSFDLALDEIDRRWRLTGNTKYENRAIYMLLLLAEYLCQARRYPFG